MRNLAIFPVISSNYYENYTPLFSINNSFNFLPIRDIDVINHVTKLKSHVIALDNIHHLFIKYILPKLLPYLVHIYNIIFIIRTYPIHQKKAKIVPIPKSAEDFRLIAILPFISKVFESIIHEQIAQFITENHILHFSQSGFRKGYSCTTALADVTEDIRKYVDDNKITFLSLPDHSKAFDSLNHES